MAGKTLAKLRKLQEDAWALVTEKGVVMDDTSQMPWLQKFAHFCVLVGRSFARNRCPVRASALAYTTLLALIPLLAVGLGVSTSLLKSQGEEPVRQLIDRLVDEVAPQLGLIPAQDAATASDARKEVVQRIRAFIGNIHSGTLGLTGTVALVLVAIGLLSTIEATFNDIWGVSRGRNFVARLVQYWAAITLGPMLVILAIGLIVGGQLETANRLAAQWLPGVGGPLLALAAYVAPFVILVGTFAMFYKLMPNTAVHWKAALIGGLVAGVLWNLNSGFNVMFAARFVNTSKIYGPLGAVPVFLIGLYFSWLILLFGAQVAYAFQNRVAYLQGRQAESVNQRGREFVAIRLMTEIGRLFQAGEPAPAAVVLGPSTGVPVRLVTQVLDVLVQARLVQEVSGEERAYTPGRPLDKITCQDILQAMRACQGQELATRESPAREIVRAEFEQIRQAEQAAAATVTVQDLVDRAGRIAGRPG